jgi:hypothetical protein
MKIVGYNLAVSHSLLNIHITEFLPYQAAYSNSNKNCLDIYIIKHAYNACQISL